MGQVVIHVDLDEPKTAWINTVIMRARQIYGQDKESAVILAFKLLEEDVSCMEQALEKVGRKVG